jgi:hypothetical protein
MWVASHRLALPLRSHCCVFLSSFVFDLSFSLSFSNPLALSLANPLVLSLSLSLVLSVSVFLCILLMSVSCAYVSLCLCVCVSVQSEEPTKVVPFDACMSAWLTPAVVSGFLSPATNKHGDVSRSVRFSSFSKYLVIQMERFFLGTTHFLSCVFFSNRNSERTIAMVDPTCTQSYVRVCVCVCVCGWVGVGGICLIVFACFCLFLFLFLLSSSSSSSVSFFSSSLGVAGPDWVPKKKMAEVAVPEELDLTACLGYARV